jgi:chromosome segregation ATPase
VPDPTTEAITAMNDEREKLRAEVARLEKALVTAYTDIEVLKANYDATARGRDEAERERDAQHGRAELCSQEARSAHVEIERLKKIGDTMFIEGYDQAVVEIRDHYKKAKQVEIAAEIETIWIKGKVS